MFIMKKIINQPHLAFSNALSGFSLAHANKVNVDTANNTVLRRTKKEAGKVALVSGGGAGHEPMHAGFVGTGMLDAACMGEIFTSPTPDQMIAAAQAVDCGSGVLYLVKNYAGDMMNFEIASEMARVTTQTVVVDDEICISELGSTATSRGRGIAGIIVVEKVTGALAERGARIDECANIARRTNERTGSIGIALSSCTVPLLACPTFSIEPDKMELGVGIHGEVGRKRVRLETADEIADIMLDQLLPALKIRSGERVLLFCNGLGATPLLELYILFDATTKSLGKRGIGVARSLIGSYCTALDMAGASITITKLDDEFVGLWDDQVNTVALNW